MLVFLFFSEDDNLILRNRIFKDYSFLTINNMFKLIILLLFVVYVIYIITVMLHILGVFAITRRRITLFRTLCPFYYWIASVNEKNQNKIIIK